MRNNIKFVLWDIGGVLTESPFKKFEIYEKSLSLPSGSIIKINSSNPYENAWAKLEKGLISTEEFSILFKEEAKSIGITNINIPKLLNCLKLKINTEMVALLKLLSKNYENICLTNNFKDVINVELKTIYDNFTYIFESSKLNMRKPEKKIYKYVLNELNIQANQILYIDDLGINLKPAREIGFLTYKFVDNKSTFKYVKNILRL